MEIAFGKINMLTDCFTDYSLLQSLLKPKDLAEYAKTQGWKFLGTADWNAGGLLDIYLACKSKGIKCLLGLRFIVTSEVGKKGQDQIILYAQNLEGYHELIKLFSKSAIEGQNNLWIGWLKDVKNLLCVLPIGTSPNEAKNDEGEAIVRDIKQIFKGKLFFGLYNHDTSIDDIWLNRAKETGIPYLFLSGARYFKTEDMVAYRVLRAISEKNTLNGLFESVWMDESIESAEKKMIDYKHQPYLDKFVGMIDIQIDTPGLKVPKFSFPEKYKSSYDYLVDICRTGLKLKKNEFEGKEKLDAVRVRMKTELDVVKKCELSDYFLLVYDICQYCDSSNIARGLGRGSASGSLISYLMGITHVNPLQYNLLFERFLNEDRTRPIIHNNEQYLTDAPDIDLDVSQLHRQQIIEWLQKKYGYVARICTHTTLTGKACIKDVMRSFGCLEKDAHQVASCVEILFGRSDSIEETYKKNSNFKRWTNNNVKIYSVIKKLEGVKKNSSIHAAGLVISSESVENRAPLFLSHTTGDEYKQASCIAYDLNHAAKAGLLKVDILGLRTLSCVQEIMTLIKNDKSK